MKSKELASISLSAFMDVCKLNQAQIELALLLMTVWETPVTV